MTIADRAFDQPLPEGVWDCIFVQATHDSAGLDIGFAQHWSDLRARGDGTKRGAYHFAHPDSTDGRAQAKLFCDRVIALGWNPKQDLWALDVEGDVQLRGAPLAQWIVDFMEYAKSKLGDRGFLYIGFPWFVTHVDHQNFSLLQRYRWWLPDYSVNNGSENPIQGGEPFPPVLHQFTSVPFDKSSILNATVWHELFLPEVIVHQEFNPPRKYVSSCLFHHPDKTKGIGGVCAADVGADGSVFSTPGDAYLGGANGQAYFQGRTAARIEPLSPNGYVIFDTAGESYKFPGK